MYPEVSNPQERKCSARIQKVWALDSHSIFKLITRFYYNFEVESQE